MADNSKKNFPKINQLQGSGADIVANFLKVFKEVGDELQGATLPGNSTPKRKNPVPVEVINNKPSSGLSWFPVVARPMLEILASAGLVIILVVFMLVRREDLRNRL